MIESLIRDFKPQITSSEYGKETTIYEMMIQYYIGHGLALNDAEATVEAYILKIKTISFSKL